MIAPTRGYLAESLREQQASRAEVHNGPYKITVRIGARTASAVASLCGWHVPLPAKGRSRWLYKDKTLQPVEFHEARWAALDTRAETIAYLTARLAGWSR